MARVGLPGRHGLLLGLLKGEAPDRDSAKCGPDEADEDQPQIDDRINAIMQHDGQFRAALGRQLGDGYLELYSSRRDWSSRSIGGI